MPQLDVAIIGAGPGGLTAAHAITRAAPSLKVGVFERTRTIERRGAGLGLDINGQKALRAIKPDLQRQLMDTAAFLHTTKVMRPNGSVISATPLRSETRLELEKQGIKTPCLLGWSELQQMLLNELPDGTFVHLGMEFDRYTEDADSVTVHFKKHEEPVQAGLLVASDGYFSRVRRQCVDDGPAEFARTLMWRARLPADVAAGTGIDMDGTSIFVQDTGRFLFGYPISSGDVVWTAAINDEKLQQLGVSASDMMMRMHSSRIDYTTQDTQGYRKQEATKGEEAKKRCIQALSGYCKPVMKLIADTPAQSVVEHGLYIRSPADMSPEAYGKGRVVVIGDAAHPMRPTGQGLNQAVEDCWALGKALVGASSVKATELKAIQDFRGLRSERLKPIMAYTLAAGEAAYKQNDDETVVRMATGLDTEVMTSQQFSDLLYTKEFESLDGLLQQLQVAA